MRLRVRVRINGIATCWILQVAIEIDGITHFYVLSRRLKAQSALKYRILSALGWKVVSIPYFEWKKRNRSVGPSVYLSVCLYLYLYVCLSVDVGLSMLCVTSRVSFVVSCALRAQAYIQ